MRKTVISLLIICLLFGSPLLVSAQEFGDLEVDGELSQKLNYLTDNEEISAITTLDLELSQKYGYDKKLYLNPLLRLNYNENEDIDDIKLNKKGEIEYDYLKEAYFDYYTKDVDFRAGRQIVNWGSAYKLNPTDVVNPLDITADTSLEELGVISLKGDYYYNFETIFSGVLIGEHRSSLLPPEIEEFAGNTISDLTKEQIYSQLKAYSQQDPNYTEADVKRDTKIIMENNFAINNPEEKEINNIQDSEIAFRALKRNFYGYDLSVSYYNGYEDLPTITSNLNDNQQELEQIIGQYLTQGQSSQLAEVEMGYKETQSLGVNAIGSIKDIGVWTEINYNQNEDEEKKLDLVVGGDYTFENGLYIVGQAFQRCYSDYQINQFLQDNNQDKLLKDQTMLMAHSEMPVQQIHNITGTLIYDIDNSQYLLHPEFELSLRQGLNLKSGLYMIEGNDEDNSLNLFNQLGSEKIYTEVSYSF